MPRFALRKLRGLEGYQSFEELVVDGNRPIHQFSEEHIGDNPTLRTEFRKIFVHMEMHSKGYLLPGEKFHELANPSRNIKEFEFKSKHIRVYCFQAEVGKIIVSVFFKEGKKSAENALIERFRNIKNEYLDSL